MKRNKYLYVNITYAGDYFCDGIIRNIRELSQRIKYYSLFFYPNEIEFIVK